MVIVPAHTSARTGPGLTAHQGTRRAGAYKSTCTPVIIRTGAANCYPARTIPAHQGVGTVVVVPAHTPGRPGPGLSAYLTTRCPGAYQRVGTLAIGTARITVRPARAYPGPAGQITCTIAIGTTNPAGRRPARPGAANQRIGTVIIVAAHAPARAAPGFPAYLGPECARAYQGFNAPAINSTRPVRGCFARPALAYPGVGTVVAGTTHTPGLTGPGLPACLRPGCSCAYQAFGTLGIGPAPIARRDAARTVTAANQQIGAIIIGTARIPDIAPRAARADPGCTHQTIRAMAIDTAQGTAHTCAGLPA